MYINACKIVRLKIKTWKMHKNWLIYIHGSAKCSIEIVVIDLRVFCLWKVCETMQWSSVYREITDSAAQGQCGHRAKVFYHK